MGELPIKRRLIVGLFAIGLAVSMVSCGGDEVPEKTTQAATTVTTGALDKEQYLDKTNVYCRHGWTNILTRYARYSDERQPGTSDDDFFAEAARAFVLPGVQFQFDAIRMFGAPAGDEEQVEEMAGTMQLEIEHGEKSRIESPQQLVALFSPYNNLAQRYGLRQCIVREAFFGAVKPGEIGL